MYFFLNYMTSLPYYSLGNTGYPRSHIPSFLSPIQCFKTCSSPSRLGLGPERVGSCSTWAVHIAPLTCFLLSLLEIPHSDSPLLLFKIKNLFQGRFEGTTSFFRFQTLVSCPFFSLFSLLLVWKHYDASLLRLSKGWAWLGVVQALPQHMREVLGRATRRDWTI